MNTLWMLLAVSLIFSLIIVYQDNRLYVFYPNRHRKDRLLTLMLILFLGVFCGLRTWYNDTVTYIQIYEQTPDLSDFADQNIDTFAQGIGFTYVNSLLKTTGFSTQDYLMFYSLITVFCYVRFVRKNTQNFPLSIFLMFTTGFYTFAFAAIKQCMATAICLVGLEFLFQRKRLTYILFVGLASLFHPYALVYLLLLFLDFRPLSGRTYVCIALFIAAGFGLSRMVGTIVDITTMMGASYDVESFVGEGVNIFRVLVCLVPTGLMLFLGRRMFVDSTRRENILCNMAMLNGLIMFVGLFGTANYFARLANYFVPAQSAVLPWMLRKFSGIDRQTMTILCIVGYIGYFIYGYSIQHVFDDSFSRITLWEYIGAHFGA